MRSLGGVFGSGADRFHGSVFDMRNLAKLGPGPGAYNVASDIFDDGDEDEFAMMEESKSDRAVLRSDMQQTMRGGLGPASGGGVLGGGEGGRGGGGGGLGGSRGHSRGGRRDRKGGIRRSSMFRSKTTRFVPKKSTTVSLAQGRAS